MTVEELVLVRHGESAGNVASAEATAAGALSIDIDARDADVELSGLGCEQARALGGPLRAAFGPGGPPAVWSSPYLRARQTAQLGLAAAGWEPPVRLDERLRDRELGILDRLSARGVAELHPDENARRRHLGKMYYRPPGGESWADVALRLRSVLADITATPDTPSALVVCHDAVIMLIRYVLEGLTEQTLLDITSRTSIANASVTRLLRAGGTWRAVEFNSVQHLEDHAVPPTAHEGDRRVHPA